MKKESADWKTAVFVLIVAVGFVLASHYTFRTIECADYSCFQENMASCSKARYVNEEAEASWLYSIERRFEGQCEIEVTLLQAKSGDLGLRDFEGHSMLCTYASGIVTYPDKDLSVCHGLLKEDLQGLIIEKLHSYILANLDDIKAGLQGSFNITANSSA